ncbi:hypothetical protein IB277_24295 [Ensifer sp. ENS07]|uniref:hypothetical protein n=1 Tax=Ensifer sp. ENS07 TaxID=2769274 RepID=UPI00177EF9C1|nr:hypothetical protein [Ensifer sp. ENS07]MBD9639411.1 hypothetical protein [Ensifer sp. ENS07]
MTLNFKTAALALNVAATASTAQAADFNNSGVDFANVDRWTGAYAGGHIGTGSSNQKGSKNKINGGVQVGYNQQFGDFVVGGEIEAARAGGLQYQVGKGGALQQTWSGTPGPRRATHSTTCCFTARWASPPPASRARAP